MHSISIGVDISKELLEFCPEDGRPSIFSNDANGIEVVVSKCPEGSVVHLEASGGYERPLRRALEKAGIQVRVHNPRRVRRLADLQGFSAKTDSLDARLLSKASLLAAPTRTKSQSQEELADLSRHIQKLKKELAGHRKQAGRMGLSKQMLANLDRLAQMLVAEIARLEKQYVQLVARSNLGERYELVQTVPCVGPSLARVLCAELPEDLSGWNTKQITSLAGVAPMDNASGKTIRTSAVGPHGNVHLKASLYMPSMVAVQRMEWAKSTYATLRAKGKSHRQAIIAVMRKLLVRIVAVLKRGSPWSEAQPIT